MSLLKLFKFDKSFGQRKSYSGIPTNNLKEGKMTYYPFDNNSFEKIRGNGSKRYILNNNDLYIKFNYVSSKGK